MEKYKRLYQIAIEIGERHGRQVIQQANEIAKLRRAIRKAVAQLRVGHAGLACHTLERVDRPEIEPDIEAAEEESGR